MVHISMYGFCVYVIIPFTIDPSWNAASLVHWRFVPCNSVLICILFLGCVSEKKTMRKSIQVTHWILLSDLTEADDFKIYKLFVKSPILLHCYWRCCQGLALGKHAFITTSIMEAAAGCLFMVYTASYGAYECWKVAVFTVVWVVS